MALQTDRPAYMIMLGAVCGLTPLAIDMGLPALTAIQQSLGVSAGQSGLTLSLFLAGFAATPLAYGLLSDRFGRRPLLIAGLALFVLGGTVCAAAPSITWLLAARLLQGAGAGAGPTIAFAATRDMLSGPALGRRVATLTMLLNVAPVIAPSIGAVVLALGSWRLIYTIITVAGVLVLAAVAFGFGETHRPSERQAGGLGAVVRRLGGETQTLTFGLINCLSGGVLFGWVAGSPLVLIGHYGVSATAYGWLFAAAATCIIGGAFVAGRLAQHLSAGSVVLIGLALTIAAAGAAAAMIASGVGTLARVFPCMAMVTFAFGLMTPPATHAALEPVPDISGTVSALLNTFRTACMSLSSLMVALLFEAIGVMAMPVTMLGFGLLCAAVLLAGHRVAVAARAA